ncbi:hypothetical protein C8R45DRAFT_233363 [Mycena sanguinolenta]|nr:hypothetical protein C8R45DRAFT_233363 [Mycena sanguinolenta]
MNERKLNRKYYPNSPARPAAQKGNSYRPALNQTGRAGASRLHSRFPLLDLILSPILSFPSTVLAPFFLPTCPFRLVFIFFSPSFVSQPLDGSHLHTFIAPPPVLTSPRRTSRLSPIFDFSLLLNHVSPLLTSLSPSRLARVSIHPTLRTLSLPLPRRFSLPYPASPTFRASPSLFIDVSLPFGTARHLLPTSPSASPRTFF